MKKQRTCLFVTLLVLVPTASLAQTQYHASLIPEQSEIKIQGTSNISSWEERIEYFNISLTVLMRSNEVTGINDIHASLKTTSVVGDHKSMTRKTRHSLKADKYPNIEFLSVSHERIGSKKGEFTATIKGNVTIAGITKRISIPFSGVVKGNKIDIKGSAKLNMDDFHIKPPTAMLGIIKVEKEVSVSFNLLFYVNR